MQIDKAYKCKSEKVKSIDFAIFNRSKPDYSNILKVYAIKNKISILDLINKFMLIIKGVRFIPERRVKRMIGDNTISQQMEV